MRRIDERYRCAVTPQARGGACVSAEKCRFTVLGEQMMRIEYDENGIFEDRATQRVVNRDFPVPEYKVVRDDEKIVISTGFFAVTYYLGRKFSKNSLTAKLNTEYCYTVFNWHYGKENDLPGTARTLDGVDGECEILPGVMSRGQISALDDSDSMVISEDGLIEKRNGSSVDLYLFAYADDYYGLLKDFYALCGGTPLLPRYALGNMWSRYHRYSQREYLELFERFGKESCPFSVAVIDMDWHLAGVDKRYGIGWTGYTWNRELFPDYKRFLNRLHEMGAEVSLNLHPADGIAPYEEMYGEMAAAMNTPRGETVPFDMTNPKFTENYFRILHNPYENDGVSFWWIDWQQGENTKYDGLDPLWLLNHFHFADIGRGNKRPMILSRYAGIGSHRYPIGFSGDSVMSWESLDFQPYFTASASNAGYTWWSHDIGGHMRGIRDDELTARWIQFGVFSPVNRLHSCEHPLVGKEPWNFSAQTEETMKRFLRLRHALIPYLYTMNYRTYKYGEPIVAPMYYRYPSDGRAYEKRFRNEFMFGTEMLAVPITSHSDGATLMGAATGFLPEGEWFDFFSGRHYSGGQITSFYRGLCEMPVLVKAGGIVPMSAEKPHNGTENPQSMLIKVFAGADNSFDLYEDDGISKNYEKGAYAVTGIRLVHSEMPELCIAAPKGDVSVLPKSRDYAIEFIGYEDCRRFAVTENGAEKDFECSCENGKITVTVKNASGELKVRFLEHVRLRKNNTEADAIEFIRRYQGKNDDKAVLYDMVTGKAAASEVLRFLSVAEIDSNVCKALAEILLAEKSEYGEETKI